MNVCRNVCKWPSNLSRESTRFNAKRARRSEICRSGWGCRMVVSAVKLQPPRCGKEPNSPARRAVIGTFRWSPVLGFHPSVLRSNENHAAVEIDVGPRQEFSFPRPAACFPQESEIGEVGDRSMSENGVRLLGTPARLGVGFGLWSLYPTKGSTSHIRRRCANNVSERKMTIAS